MNQKYQCLFQLIQAVLLVSPRPSNSVAFFQELIYCSKKLFQACGFFPLQLKGLLNVAPASSIFIIKFGERIWNPPESVKMILFQLMNLCSPLNFFIVSRPGFSERRKAL